MNMIKRKIPVLFDKKEECCGCDACLNICAKNAISMREDQYGFLYPYIDEKLCVACGRCKYVCAFQNKEETNVPLETFAAVSRDNAKRKKSAAGGILLLLLMTS